MLVLVLLAVAMAAGAAYASQRRWPAAWQSAGAALSRFREGVRHGISRPPLGPAPARAQVSVREAVRRLRSTDAAIALALAAALAATAFIANGGLQLGTLDAGRGRRDPGRRAAGRGRARGGRLRGPPARRARARRAGRARGAHRALDRSGRCIPPDSWVETNRTLRLPRRIRGRHRGGAHRARTLARRCSAGVLLALAAICLWGLATKVAPGLARARTRSTAGCASRTGTGTRSASPPRWACRSASGSAPARAAAGSSNALAYPLLGALHRDDAAELLARQHRRRRSSASRSGWRSCRCGCAAWRCCCPRCSRPAP